MPIIDNSFYDIEKSRQVHKYNSKRPVRAQTVRNVVPDVNMPVYIPKRTYTVRNPLFASLLAIFESLKSGNQKVLISPTTSTHYPCEP
jgi:hypothetical protein